MRQILLLVVISLSINVAAQHTVSGFVRNATGEAVPLATVQVKGYSLGTVTNEKGFYNLELEGGSYELIISIIGYKRRILPLVVEKTALQVNILLEDDEGSLLGDVIIKGKFRDRAEEYVRQVIRKKEETLTAAGSWSANVYIKAFQEDSSAIQNSKKKKLSDSVLQVRQRAAAFDRLAFSEIALRLDRSGDRMKEERTGIHKKGEVSKLLYLSVTEGDFDLYSNLIHVPKISATPFISPLSNSGLVGYRYKSVRTDTIDGRKVYVISARPRQLSNATIEAELWIVDSLWVLLHAEWKLPKYHLTEFDFFEVDQDFTLVRDTAWMLSRQILRYVSKSDKQQSTGETIATYTDYELRKQFSKNYFGVELSSASEEAYKRDSNFWNSRRTQPLSQKQVQLINYRDSIYQATHTKAYLDSLDRETNKITWQRLLIKGPEYNDHVKRSHWSFPSLPSIYQPIQFGGARLMLMATHSKTASSRRDLYINTELSYGMRNRDFNGSLQINRLYNPIKRGYWNFRLEKDFEYIFSGDAWINMIKRNNIYLHRSIELGHSVELKNGLYLFSNLEYAYRSSVAKYRTNSKMDSLFGSVLDDNQAIDFAPYTAMYGSLRLEYTPAQRYIREPKEKVILGSSWPTFYASWRKGLAGLLRSTVDFDYSEIGIKQTLKLGTTGISSYSFKTGKFINQRDLRLVDYKFQRRGDPFLFMNPNDAFQSLDSSFPVFKRFYEAHYVHEFNGAILNRIPLLKKLGLREVAGGGFLSVPERNLKYIEAFAGIEKVFKYPFHLLGKFKVGVYVVGSAANQFRNPVQFKIGITTWDRKTGKWF